MDETLYIPVLLGTVRPGRRSYDAAKLVADVGSDLEGIETEFVDPKDFEFPLDGSGEDQKDPRYTKLTAKADAFFIVTPEYNHSFPGTLKRMLDSELKNYVHKPVAIAGVSSGPWGGVRAIEALIGTLREMGMVATFTDVNFPKIKDIFDDKGNLQDEAYIKRIKSAYTELLWMAKTLKWGRNNVPSEHHE